MTDRWDYIKKRGFGNRDLPHHRIEWGDEIGPIGTYCKCGYRPSSSRYWGLEEHIMANDDNICHFKKYKLECTRIAGHRGIHREIK